MNKIFDCIVIGGGPAGMMAAGQAASRGMSVALLEKNNRLGKKILLTGHGRCNITNTESDLRQLVKAYGEHGPFLFSALNSFGPKEVIKFFESLGVPIKVEKNNRAFPKSDSAEDVVNALKKYLQDAGTEIYLEAKVIDIKLKREIWEVELANKKMLCTKSLILATGGLSYAHTGSTGEGLEWACGLKHKVTKTMPALVPIKVKEKWIKELSGVSVEDVKMIAIQGRKKIAEERGEMLFTHFGLSGPMVLNMSNKLVKAQRDGEVELNINFFPELNKEEIDEKLRNEFAEAGSKLCKNVLDKMLPRALVEVVLKLAQVSVLKKSSEINKAERFKIVNLLHDFKISVMGNLGYEVAMVTSGGVDLSQVDPKTMRSKIYDNLYFVGEILDVDGPTGGYNLQIAWSTGYTAGNSIKI